MPESHAQREDDAEYLVKVGLLVVELVFVFSQRPSSATSTTPRPMVIGGKM